MKKFKIIALHTILALSTLSVLCLCGYFCISIGDYVGLLAVILLGFLMINCVWAMFSMSIREYNNEKRRREYQEKYGKIVEVI